MSIFLRNRLKLALTGREVTAIVKQRLIQVDGKVRTDDTYPLGFMDVVTIEKSGENFRILYDVKGRFTIHRISAEEASYKLLKVKKVQLGAKGVPYVVTHDGRTIRFPDPKIRVNASIKCVPPARSCVAVLDDEEREGLTLVPLRARVR
jgi:small subunit ribosomal protein S4e